MLPTSRVERTIGSAQKIPLDVGIARVVGIDAALVLQQLNYAMFLAQDNPACALEGRIWIRRTYAEWLAFVPLGSEKSVRRVICRLERAGIVISRQDGYDRRKGYTIDFAALAHVLEAGGRPAHPGASNVTTVSCRLPEVDAQVVCDERFDAPKMSSSIKDKREVEISIPAQGMRFEAGIDG